MYRSFCLLATVSFIPLLWQSLPAEEAVAPKPTPEDAAKRQAGLEKKFKDTLTNAILEGRWSTIAKGKLGTESTERYTVSRVIKLGDSKQWIIFARVQYGKKDVTLPVPVRVEWADDTPVISITNAGLPGLGTYSARVMIYEGLYAGTWFGAGHGGVLSGQILKSDDKKVTEGGAEPEVKK